MIQIKDLCLSFNKEFNILDNVNLTINSGDKIALVGASGSGKTCLLRSILGLEEFQSGEIFINNLSIKNINFKTDVSVGYVPKNPVLLENKTVKANLEYVLKNRKVDQASINFKVINALKTFDIESIRNFTVKDLSLYHKSVVQLARVCQRKIEIFIIDDITEKLSSNEQENILDYFKMMMENYPNATFVFSFSNREFAERLGLKIYNMANGKISN